jgi:hypothetical protein
MQQIVMDVKVIDCLVRRPDGSAAWPRMVAFMDTATQRLFRRFFLLRPGEGIRQEHVAMTFLEMAADPAWGFPQQLYRDNGSEFFVLDLIRTALEHLKPDNVRTIINARPYSAASKPIESKFAMLDRFVFSQMRGWAGGNRMLQKSEALGTSPEPYRGSFSEFVVEADERMRIFEDTPIQTGPFAGKSPQQLFTNHLLQGWQPVLVPIERLDAAFCTRETRRVSNGMVKIAGARHRHPELVNGQSVTLALPWRRGAQPLAHLPEQGWVPLERDLPFAPIDFRGAQESDRRKRQYDALTNRLKVQAGSIDLEANRQDRLAAMAVEIAPVPIIDASVLPAQKELASALINEATFGAQRRVSAQQKRRAATEELERYIAKQEG